MSDRLKRILFIVFFLIFTVAVGYGIYYVFFRPKEVVVVTPPGEEPTGELPGAGPAVPGTPVTEQPPGTLPGAGNVPGGSPGQAPAPQTILLRDSVTQGVSPSMDGQGARFYDPDDGKFYRVNADGASTALSAQAFPNLDTVTWGKSTDQAILAFPDGSKVHYDFTTEKQTTLPKNWSDFNFSGDDKQVVAKNDALNPGSRYLIVANPDGSNSHAVEPLGNNAAKVFPEWTPNNQIIAYATVGDPRGFDRQEIILVGQNHENFRGLEVEGRGFLPLWSPDGQQLLYSVWNAASEYKPELWLQGGSPDNLNENRTKLDIQTWADKCVWGGNTVVYCAVPDTLGTGAGLQPDLFQDIPDSFIKIDLATGARTQLGKPTGDLNVKNPVLTADAEHIIFTDGQTGRLYDFRLP